MSGTRIKVGVATVLSLLIGWCLYYSNQPMLTCRAPFVVRDAIPVKKDQAVFEHTYTIYNRSLQTVTIDDVKASCNCQSVTSDRVIPPRSKGEVKATFAVARNMVGETHAEFLVFANKLGKPILRLQMTYSFELGVWSYPEQIDLGRVVNGNPVEFEISVRQEKVAKRSPALVQSIDAEDIFFDVLPIEDEPSSKNTQSGGATLLSQKIIGRFTNDFKVGYHDRVVSIHVGHPDYPLLAVPVRWESVAEQNFSPSTLHFGFMEAASKSSRTITLISEADPLHVQHATVSGDGFRLESQNQIASNRVAFVIEASTGTAPGLYKGQLTVRLATGKDCQAGLMTIVE